MSIRFRIILQIYTFCLVVARKSYVIFIFSSIKFGLFISKSYLCNEKGVLVAFLKNFNGIAFAICLDVLKA